MFIQTASAFCNKEKRTLNNRVCVISSHRLKKLYRRALAL